MYIRNNQKKAGDADEEYVQATDDDDDDDEEEVKPPTDSMTLIGRDKEGKFMHHHDNYLKLKNRINEQEKGHQGMFDSINEKLNDATFL